MKIIPIILALTQLGCTHFSTFVPTKKSVFTVFKADLDIIKKGYQLCSTCHENAYSDIPSFQYLDKNGTKVVLGDINNDQKIDAIIQYQFDANLDSLDEAMGLEHYDMEGFAVYINDGKKLSLVQKIGVSDVLSYATLFNESVIIDSIEKDGSIVLKKVVNLEFNDEEKQYPNKNVKFIERSFKTTFKNNHLHKID